MDFIIEQQEKFSIDFEKDVEAIAKIDNVALRLANGMVERLEQNEDKTDKGAKNN